MRMAFKRAGRAGVVSALMVTVFGCGGDSKQEIQPEPLSITRVGFVRRQPRSAVIRWKTTVPSTGVVRYGLHPDSLGHKAQSGPADSEHRVTLGPLSHSTRYFYQITATEKGGQTATSNVGELNTPLGRRLALINTSLGDITVELFGNIAPGHVTNFSDLSRQGFYDGTTFHRVIPGFMIQGGDPNSRDRDPSNDGRGGPGYTQPAEISAPHLRGSLAAARTSNPEKRSSGSQFYICVAPQPGLDQAGYTVFGQTVSGMDVVDRIVAVKRDGNDNPLNRIVIEGIRLVD